MIRLLTLALVLVLTLALGCGGDNDAKKKDKTANKKPETDHNHAKGPHDGHVVELGEEEAHAEWLHNDETGTLTIYILDDHMHEEVAIGADSITIETKLGDKTETTSVPAVRAAAAKKTAKFEIVDKPLIERLKLAGPGLDARIMVDFNGKKLEGKFEKHED